jgi:cell division protein YceG involved in septum cleavage
MKELGMAENELLTLASIIEKEAIVDSERPSFLLFITTG